MDRNRDIYQQIKKATMQQTSADFTLEVIRKAGIEAKKLPREASFLSNRLYGWACLLTGFLIFILVVTDVQSVNRISTEQTGKNAISLTKQLETGFKEYINNRG